jgi:C4-dicarboxylate-specific signal transduction histidine kinase
VERLTEGTHRIAAGEFGHMVKVDAARELQELSGALNTVSASLLAYRQRTREQVERLEQANAELRQAQEALVRSEKLAGLGRLAAGLAHEIGNPLAAVLGYMELLEQGLGDPELERDMVRRAQQELGRIHGILRQLLDYARPGTGRAEEIEVGVALEEAARTVRPQRSFREVELRIHAQEGLPRLLLERDKLHQVLVNLLVNAGHAVAGRPGAAVELRACREGERLRIDCLDNGHGFDPVALDRAFEPFFTTKDVGQGTGLGLATCQRVVEAAGGQVGLANQPQGGAMVSLWLPPAP